MRLRSSLFSFLIDIFHIVIADIFMLVILNNFINILYRKFVLLNLSNVALLGLNSHYLVLVLHFLLDRCLLIHLRGWLYWLLNTLVLDWLLINQILLLLLQLNLSLDFRNLSIKILLFLQKFIILRRKLLLLDFLWNWLLFDLLRNLLVFKSWVLLDFDLKRLLVLNWGLFLIVWEHISLLLLRAEEHVLIIDFWLRANIDFFGTLFLDFLRNLRFLNLNNLLFNFFLLDLLLSEQHHFIIIINLWLWNWLFNFDIWGLFNDLDLLGFIKLLDNLRKLIRIFSEKFILILDFLDLNSLLLGKVHDLFLWHAK